MDGDLRPRWRRPAPLIQPGDSWGYTATIPADLGHPIAAPAAQVDTRPPRRDEPGDKTAPNGKPEDKKPDNKKSDDQEKDNKTEDKDEAKDDNKAKKTTPRWKKVLYWAIGLIILSAIIIAGILYYF